MANRHKSSNRMIPSDSPMQTPVAIQGEILPPTEKSCE